MLYVIGPKELRDTGDNDTVINVTSHSKTNYKQLSPFYLGPVKLYGNYVAQNVENGYQYAKTYARFLDKNNNPNEDYFKWAQQGWNNKWAVRYPMGKGAKPVYSWWDGEKLSYIEARKKIYIPLYSNAVKKTKSFKKLKLEYEFKVEVLGEDMFLWDFDGYNHKEMGMTYENVINNPKRPMGHVFVVAMLLEGEI